MAGVRFNLDQFPVPIAQVSTVFKSSLLWKRDGIKKKRNVTNSSGKEGKN